jgi:hypothetical protein
MTFEEYQNLAAQVPITLRNDCGRIELPALGLQAAAGRLGKWLFTSGKFQLTPEQNNEVKDRMADVLWHVTRLCGETGILMESVAEVCIVKLQTRTEELDPDRR